MAAGVVDAHVHVCDFLQECGDPRSLERAMDRAGVDAAVVFGLPYKKKWSYAEPHRPSYYLDDESACYPWPATDEALASWFERAGEPAWLAPTVCGVEATDMDAADRVDELLSAGPFRGVGELLLRHGRLSTHVVGERPRVDHPAVRRIVDVCALHEMPVAVHQNGGSTGQGDLAYVDEMERLLEWRDDVDVIWCHAGISGERVGPTPTDLDALLTRFPHLHVDLSWSATEELDDGDVIDERWADLAVGHPERLVWGSDSLGRFDDLPARVGRFRRFLRLLPARVAALVAGGNARRLWWPG